MLTLALSASAATPKASDAGRFIKIIGKQDVPSEVAEDDIYYISKTSIVRFDTSKQRVEIWLTTGTVAFAFESKEDARAFLAQIAEFCTK